MMLGGKRNSVEMNAVQLKEGMDVLCLELVWGNSLSMLHQLPIEWDHIWLNIQLTIITHDWIQY